MSQRALALLAFLWALFVTNLRSALSQRLSFWLEVGFMALNNVTFFVFWWVLFDHVPDLHGWQLPDVQLLFGLSATAFGLAVGIAGGVLHLGQFVDEGALDPLLVQPKPTLLHALGMRSRASGFGDVLSGLGFLWLSGYVDGSTAPLVVLAVLAGALTFVSGGVVFFSLAFWLGRSESLARQLWSFLLTFSLYPDPLFGGALRLLLFTLLPAGFASYLPARAVREASLLDALGACIGAAAYTLFAVWFFGRGLRRYSSGSRFGSFG